MIMSSSSKGVILVTGAGHSHTGDRSRHCYSTAAADGFDVAINDIASNENNGAALVKEIQGKGRRSCQMSPKRIKLKT